MLDAKRLLSDQLSASVRCGLLVSFIAIPYQAQAQNNPLPAAPPQTLTLDILAMQTNSPGWQTRPTAEDISRNYPRRAANKGVAGDVALLCTIDAKGKLASCTVGTEIPVGWGFGAAAMRISTLFTALPRDDVGRKVAGMSVVVPLTFGSKRPQNGVTPLFRYNIPWIGGATWVSKPGDREFAEHYPPRALKRDKEGSVLLDCVAVQDGALQCNLVREKPDGWGFGAAALELAALYKIATKTPTGELISGGRISLPITFKVPSR